MRDRAPHTKGLAALSLARQRQGVVMVAQGISALMASSRECVGASDIRSDIAPRNLAISKQFLGVGAKDRTRAWI